MVGEIAMTVVGVSSCAAAIFFALRGMLRRAVLCMALALILVVGTRLIQQDAHQAFTTDRIGAAQVKK